MTAFSVWAPRRAQVDLVLDDTRIPMTAAGDWWKAVAEGTDYGFSLDGGPLRPDPRSTWQPAGVHGASRIYDHGAFTWTDARWHGVPLAGAICYELHVGTFTPEGTFDAALDRLDHLVDLGITVVELLPCNGFDGRWGWGYDGVLWYAVHEPYGGPDGLKRFVDAAHAKGLGVAMDVVYNHLGPAGNYLPEFGPYLTDDHHTPWGPAVNLDRAGSDQVRRFVLDSALAWLRDFHIDGLRLDAVHALVDDSATHLLQEMSTEVQALAAQLGKPLWLVAESDLNDPRTVKPREAGGLGLDGQWSDDVHHALHSLLTGETGGYYCDFGSLEVLAKALTGAFVHDGTWSTFRERTHGRPVPATIPGHRFVVYLQDHDQVGNRALGDRIGLSPGLARVGAALYLLSPYTPMVFMGEEFGATTPWPFFSDHVGDLGEAVRQGRRAEFARHGWQAQEVPDPQSPETFASAKLDWDGQDATLLAYYRSLIVLRRSRADLSDGRRDKLSVTWEDDARWLVVRRGDVAIACNLSAGRQAVTIPGTPLRVLLASTDGWSFRDQRVEIDGESVVVLELVAG
jgi:maltooligosyltrehalose trehalohydrolase